MCFVVLTFLNVSSDISPTTKTLIMKKTNNETKDFQTIKIKPKEKNRNPLVIELHWKLTETKLN